jgi:ABC-type bacteriocin/lantibiotic exporter with double-glycine peptidase domain
MILFEDVSIFYNDEKILQNLSFDVPSGNKVLVSGKSGIGKSSLIKALLGFVTYTGHIQLNDVTVKSSNIDKIRKMVSYMPQEINMPINSVMEFINFSMSINSKHKIFKNYVFELLEKFKIDRNLLKKQISEISGGQKQRIILATCMAQNKDILLLDEPDSSMDIENKKIIRDYLMNLNKTILLISHDLEWSNYVNKTFNLDKNGRNN